MRDSPFADVLTLGDVPLGQVWSGVVIAQGRLLSTERRTTVNGLVPSGPLTRVLMLCAIRPLEWLPQGYLRGSPEVQSLAALPR